MIKEQILVTGEAVSYTRGTDLSGSLQGAGGIGGLLGRSYNDYYGETSRHDYYHADGNGNITYLVNSSQALAASYRYDPFGNIISQSGDLADANVYRFSSKAFDPLSGLYYYGYRWYSPQLQRWLNRDPIEERGGINLYRFVRNDAVGFVDPHGLSWLGDYMDDVGKGIYDWMMGEDQGHYNRDSYGAMRAEALGGIDPHDNVLRDSMGQAARTLADLGQEAAKQYTGAKVGGVIGAACGRLGSLSSRTTYLYQKVGAAGEHLKFGITSNPNTRYTIAEMAGGRLRILETGTRADMLKLERALHRTLPLGPEESQFFTIYTSSFKV